MNQIKIKKTHQILDEFLEYIKGEGAAAGVLGGVVAGVVIGSVTIAFKKSGTYFIDDTTRKDKFLVKLF